VRTTDLSRFCRTCCCCSPAGYGAPARCSGWAARPSSFTRPCQDSPRILKRQSEAIKKQADQLTG